MRHFPIFLDLRGRQVVVAGAGAAAVAKLRLILKTEAAVTVIGPHPDPQIVAWATEGLLTLEERGFEDWDADGAALLYAAFEDEQADARVVAIGHVAGVLVNIVDVLEGSDFLTPAIVDRDPVTIAIGTEGAAPVLARQIKAELEERLPSSLGLLARLGQAFRPVAASLPHGFLRREFWSRFYFDAGPRALADGGEDAARAALVRLHAETPERARGRVDFIGTGPGEPDLLTLRARNLLHEADLVFHDPGISAQILELARREAEFHSFRAGLAGILAGKAAKGARIAVLLPGNPSAFRLGREMAALADAGLAFTLVPGLQTADPSEAPNIIPFHPVAGEGLAYGEVN